MADQQSLKRISITRIKTAKLLIDAKDWHGAGYMLGYGLECALKSVICKTLNFKEYPGSRKKDDEWFLTHRFDRLLMLSGMLDIFGAGKENFYVWSECTKYYEGDWPSMRYNERVLDQFTEESVPYN